MIMDIIIKIEKILVEKNIDHYRINLNKSESAELFYIKHELDTIRSTDTMQCNVTVYKDFEAEGKKMRGSAVCIIFPDMTDREIAESISGAYYAASFVKNKYYELPQRSEGNNNEDTPKIPAKSDLTAEAFKMAEALFNAEDEKERQNRSSFINSCEIFAVENNIRIVTSEGIDVSYSKNKYSGEFVTQSVSCGRDVEIHTQFSYEEAPGPRLTEKAREALRTVRDRAEAVLPPRSGRYSVILTAENAASILGYYISRTRGGMIYAGYSSFEKGCLIQGNDVNFNSERLNIVLKATEPYSHEGIPMKDRILTKDGKLETIHCGARFAGYLNIEATGDYTKIQCLNGSRTFESMKEPSCGEEKILLVSSFSDFQTDDFTGQFGGEIRLAYLFEKNGGQISVKKLTGGSISGQLIEAQNTAVFSKERYKDSEYDGPYAVKFTDISVAGAE